MEKIREVETAKDLMTEAMRWSVMRWLTEKKRVRTAADAANAALDHRNAAVKASWPDRLKKAYSALVAGVNGGKMKAESARSADLLCSVRNVRSADEEARKAREVAEKTFDDAEKRLSTSLAREGCRMAIDSWELHEKAIRKAEEVAKQV